jgi:hypothetical protein
VALRHKREEMIRKQSYDCWDQKARWKISVKAKLHNHVEHKDNLLLRRLFDHVRKQAHATHEHSVQLAAGVRNHNHRLLRMSILGWKKTHSLTLTDTQISQTIRLQTQKGMGQRYLNVWRTRTAKALRKGACEALQQRVQTQGRRKLYWRRWQAALVIKRQRHDLTHKAEISHSCRLLHRALGCWSRFTTLSKWQRTYVESFLK